MQAAQMLSMGEMSARSSVSEGTLRMREARRGFPTPMRLPSGHRHYSMLEPRRVTAVMEARERGLSPATAIERARWLTDEARPSGYSALREGFSFHQPRSLRKRALLALSHATEDGSCARAERPLLFGCAHDAAPLVHPSRSGPRRSLDGRPRPRTAGQLGRRRNRRLGARNVQQLPPPTAFGEDR